MADFLDSKGEYSLCFPGAEGLSREICLLQVLTQVLVQKVSVQKSVFVIFLLIYNCNFYNVQDYIFTQSTNTVK